MIPTKNKCPVTEKWGYDTKYFAEKIILANLKKKSRQENRVYKCEHCGKWHLTHKPQISNKKEICLKTGKMGYEDERYIKKNVLKFLNEDEFKRTKIYKCKHCGLFHFCRKGE